MKILSRESVERVAHIIGEHSAAAQALAEADEVSEPVVFVQYRDHLFVVRDPRLAPTKESP